MKNKKYMFIIVLFVFFSCYMDIEEPQKNQRRETGPQYNRILVENDNIYLLTGHRDKTEILKNGKVIWTGDASTDISEMIVRNGNVYMIGRRAGAFSYWINEQRTDLTHDIGDISYYPTDLFLDNGVLYISGYEYHLIEIKKNIITHNVITKPFYYKGDQRVDLTHQGTNGKTNSIFVHQNSIIVGGYYEKMKKSLLSQTSRSPFNISYVPCYWENNTCMTLDHSGDHAEVTDIQPMDNGWLLTGSYGIFMEMYNICYWDNKITCTFPDPAESHIWKELFWYNNQIIFAGIKNDIPVLKIGTSLVSLTSMASVYNRITDSTTSNNQLYILGRTEKGACYWVIENGDFQNISQIDVYKDKTNQ